MPALSTKFRNLDTSFYLIELQKLHILQMQAAQRTQTTAITDWSPFWALEHLQNIWALLCTYCNTLKQRILLETALGQCRTYAWRGLQLARIKTEMDSRSLITAETKRSYGAEHQNIPSENSIGSNASPGRKKAETDRILVTIIERSRNKLRHCTEVDLCSRLGRPTSQTIPGRQNT